MMFEISFGASVKSSYPQCSKAGSGTGASFGYRYIKSCLCQFKSMGDN